MHMLIWICTDCKSQPGPFPMEKLTNLTCMCACLNTKTINFTIMFSMINISKFTCPPPLFPIAVSPLFNPFPHTTILQQMTLNIFCQKMKNLYNWMDKWLKVENIVAKGEIARFEQFLLLSLCFQKAVCCKGVRKRLHKGKG